MFSWICGSLMGTNAGILIALTYYVLRPKDQDRFILWFRGGGLYGVLLILACLIFSLLCTSLMLTYYGVWFMLPLTKLCGIIRGISNGYSYFLNSYQVAAITVVYGGTWFVWLVSFIIML